MSASQVEQHWALTHGVVIRHHLAPQALLGQDGRVSAITLAVQQEVDGRLQPTGEVETLAADQVLKAIGQKLALPWAESAGLAIQGAASWWMPKAAPRCRASGPAATAWPVAAT
jgi:glutamate synthase (NADPH/NADH) small chain